MVTGTTADRDAILRAVLDDPADDLPRLAYADWCEENGQPERGEFIRTQCRIATLADLSGHPKATPLAWSCKCDVCKEAKPLRRRERELFIGAGPGQLEWFGPLQAAIPAGTLMSSLLPWFRRGFIHHVAVTTDAFLRDARSWFKLHPILSVRLLDRSPERAGDLYFWSLVSWARFVRSTPHHLPDPPFGYLESEYRQDGSGRAHYASKEAAWADLSRVCVENERRWSGLPWVKPVPC